jgi:threonine dehydratase
MVLSDLLECRCFCKLEFMHRTGSFKERGARNALCQLPREARTRGVVAASAGNHALALAYHAKALGIPVTVVMPRFAPLIKRSRCTTLGAKVIIGGENIADAKQIADQLVDSEGLTYIHGFDSPEVIAGQGTVALEVLEEVPDVDAVVVPVGGAGLIAGVGLTIKALKPRVEVVGVEPRAAASFHAALAHGSPVAVSMKPTLADGLAVPKVGDRAFAIARSTVDRVVLVSEEEISLSILRLAELEKGVVEGAGAAPLAAMLSGQLSHLKGKCVVLLLCGGNIDPVVLGRVIDYGLVADGRMTQFAAIISDRPGGLAELTLAIAETGASVQQINHDRTFSDADVSTVHVVCTVETRDAAHIDQVHGAVRKRGIRIISHTSPATCEIPH